MRILGIHDGHNATACLLEDSQIKYVIQEERLTRIKNHSKFPSSAIKMILQLENLNYEDISSIVMSSNHMPNNMTTKELINDYKNSSSLSTRLKRAAKKTLIMDYYRRNRREQRIQPFMEEGYPRRNVTFTDHHLSHAAAAYFGSPWWKNERVLILTNDGGGDGVCATVNVGENGRITTLARLNVEHSVGYIYSMITFILGMVPEEHEYKVMGMAPYCSEVKAVEVAKKFRQLIEFNDRDGGITWSRANGCPPTQYSYEYFKQFTEGMRFDWICGGLQKFFEEMILEWVGRCVQKTGIRKVALGGGSFMNVKANMRIMEMNDIGEIFVFPSCGDESNAIGCAYLKYAQEKLKNGEAIALQSLEGLYYGPEYSEAEIEQVLGEAPYRHQRCNDIEQEAAKLLAAGHIVARFKGRLEFGARALGNRSILANPSRPEVVRIVNEMVKNRDFWMPFAPSILDTRADDYIKLTKNTKLPYMMIATDSISGSNELLAAMHPYDRTIRPQIVYRDWNKDYWNLIKHFEKFTGIGAVLNTSFNLHGFPIICTPADAMEVFSKSGLRYMAIGNFLVEK